MERDIVERQTVGEKIPLSVILGNTARMQVEKFARIFDSTHIIDLCNEIDALRTEQANTLATIEGLRAELAEAQASAIAFRAAHERMEESYRSALADSRVLAAEVVRRIGRDRDLWLRCVDPPIIDAINRHTDAKGGA